MARSGPQALPFEWRKAVLCQLRQSHPTITWFMAA